MCCLVRIPLWGFYLCGVPPFPLLQRGSAISSKIGDVSRGIRYIRKKQATREETSQKKFQIRLFAFNFKKMYYLPHNKKLKTFSRKLRNNSTSGEILLWKQLRTGSMKGYTFNRQKPLNNYIVDFYCKPLKLVIEVDGGYHFEEERKIKDQERQQILQTMGLNFLRFHDEEIRKI